jgi:glycosyltransferase involved in cell wall biosynthesis
MNPRIGLLVLDTHPVQYRVPVYRQLAGLLASSGDRLHVVYGSNSSVRGALDPGFGEAVTWDIPMLAGYEHEFLPGAAAAPPSGFLRLRGGGIERVIRNMRPRAVLLNGLNNLLFLRALFTARLLGIPVWLRSETQDHAFARSSGKALARRLAYRVLYSLVDHFFPIGELNAAHYRAHGVADHRMTFCRYCVEDRFDAPAAELQRRRQEKRAELGFSPDRRVVMFSGKLIPKKAPMLLIEALQRMALAERAKFALLYVGSGEQEELLRRKSADMDVPVVFAGFVNQSQIADYYLASDAVALPSQQMGETWGLVANEALLAGKPLILSRHAGSSADFCEFPEVQVIDPTPATLAEALGKLPEDVSPHALRTRMARYSIEAAADAIFSRIGQVNA